MLSSITSPHLRYIKTNQLDNVPHSLQKQESCSENDTIQGTHHSRGKTKNMLTEQLSGSGQCKLVWHLFLLSGILKWRVKKLEENHP